MRPITFLLVHHVIQLLLNETFNETRRAQRRVGEWPRLIETRMKLFHSQICYLISHEIGDKGSWNASGSLGEVWNWHVTAWQVVQVIVSVKLQFMRQCLLRDWLTDWLNWKPEKCLNFHFHSFQLIFLPLLTTVDYISNSNPLNPSKQAHKKHLK